MIYLKTTMLNLIAEINKRFERFIVYEDVLDGRSRDRLKLDHQTGSLTITHTTTEHTGVYQLMKITKRRLSSKVFRVSVYSEQISFFFSSKYSHLLFIYIYIYIYYNIMWTVKIIK